MASSVTRLPVAQIGSHQLLIFLLQVGLLLLLATASGRLAARLGTSAVVGELGAGILAGPSLLAHVAPTASAWLLPRNPGQFHLLDAAGEIGVILLVGITGMQMDVGRARSRAMLAVRVGGAGFLVPLAAGLGLGLALPATFLAGRGQRTAFALFLGIALGVSALPVITRILADLRLTHGDIGQLILCAVTVDDIAGWLLLALIPSLTTGGPGAATAIWPLAGLALLIAGAIAARPLVRAGLRAVGRAPGSGPTIAVTVSLLFLAAAASQAVRVEPVIGAFGCGLLIRSCAVDTGQLAPLDTTVLSVLAPLYFTIAGLRMDLTSLARPGVLAVGVLVLIAAVVTKIAGGYAGARLGGLDHWSGLALGAGINSRGVIEVIIAMTGLQLGVLTEQMYTIIVLVAITTSIMTPASLKWAMARVEPAPDIPAGAGGQARTGSAGPRARTAFSLQTGERPGQNGCAARDSNPEPAD